MNLITIDGPAGSGKGTIARILSDRLHLNYLDSGAIYRVIALFLNRNHIPDDDEQLIKQKIKDLNIVFLKTKITLNNDDVTEEIRSEKIAKIASHISSLKSVRASILDLQRSYFQPPGLVAEGRDMGTVVFPEANKKFFLTASTEERANRRYKQLISKGFDVNIHNLVSEIQERDDRDINRKISPLVPASDAHQIDTTYLSPDEVVNTILQKI
ncbi:MAG: (d)CMP kinase [Proteobacteria bacterium]|jgi:CMP/dCMP kinase|nr:(d)CMP kinase [Pseudomonadota bacterium]